MLIVGLDLCNCNGDRKLMNLQSMRRQDVPLHAEVAAVLRHQIKSGDLPHGTQLPALRELTETLGVARMTIVQAMNTLEDEGLIERHSGRGTFVKKIPVPNRHTLQMHANISQIYSMVSQLEVDVQDQSKSAEVVSIGGRNYRSFKRTHVRSKRPFCHVELRLDAEIYDKAPDRFRQEIAVSVLQDLGFVISSAKQKITISYADFALAEALDINVNAAVFRVTREFYDAESTLVYSAVLIYPGELLELEIDFSVPNP